MLIKCRDNARRLWDAIRRDVSTWGPYVELAALLLATVQIVLELF
ncbi:MULTISPECIES: hypothetical protein [Actinomadura]|nr:MULTISPECIES: hypothetical protein [Actinomadura]